METIFKEILRVLKEDLTDGQTLTRPSKAMFTLERCLYTVLLNSSQTQERTSHPVASALKCCNISKRLRNELRKISLVEMQ